MIPIYRGERYLAEAIQSALDQDYSPIEIILVDDGSPDDSVSIATQFMTVHPSSIRLLTHERNQGVSAAWNTAMEASQGSYALRLAQDDVLMPDAVTRLVGLLVSRPEADVAYGENSLFSPGGKPIAHRPVAPDSEIFRSDNHIGLGVMVSRRVLDSTFRYDLAIRAAEDLDFFSRLFDHGYQFVRLPDPPVVKVRIHPEMGSAVNRVRQELESARILARREPRWKLRHKIYEAHHVNAAHHLRSAAEWGCATAVAWAGITRCPWSPVLWKEWVAALLRIPARS